MPSNKGLRTNPKWAIITAVICPFEAGLLLWFGFYGGMTAALISAMIVVIGCCIRVSAVAPFITAVYGGYEAAEILSDLYPWNENYGNWTWRETLTAEVVAVCLASVSLALALSALVFASQAPRYREAFRAAREEMVKQQDGVKKTTPPIVTEYAPNTRPEKLVARTPTTPANPPKNSPRLSQDFVRAPGGAPTNAAQQQAYPQQQPPQAYQQQQQQQLQQQAYPQQQQQAYPQQQQQAYPQQQQAYPQQQLQQQAYPQQQAPPVAYQQVQQVPQAYQQPQAAYQQPQGQGFNPAPLPQAAHTFGAGYVVPQNFNAPPQQQPVVAAQVDQPPAVQNPLKGQLNTVNIINKTQSGNMYSQKGMVLPSGDIILNEPQANPPQHVQVTITPGGPVHTSPTTN